MSTAVHTVCVQTPEPDEACRLSPCDQVTRGRVEQDGAGLVVWGPGEVVTLKTDTGDDSRRPGDQEAEVGICVYPAVPQEPGAFRSLPRVQHCANSGLVCPALDPRQASASLQ